MSGKEMGSSEVERLGLIIQRLEKRARVRNERLKKLRADIQRERSRNGAALRRVKEESKSIMVVSGGETSVGDRPAVVIGPVTKIVARSKAQTICVVRVETP